MKIVSFTLFLISFCMNTQAQSTVTVQMGSENHTITGTKLFAGNESESTYYTISDGIFHYYYINNYNGKCIQLIHSSCPVKSIDIKTVAYKDYEDFGNFMYLDTKKLEDDVNHSIWADGEFSGPSIDINITKTEEEKSSLMLVVSSTEAGQTLLDLIKKGKDL